MGLVMSRRLAGYERVGQLDELHGLALPNLEACAAAAPISSGEAKGWERRQRVGEIFARAPHQAHTTFLPQSMLLLLLVTILTFFLLVWSSSLVILWVVVTLLSFSSFSVLATVSDIILMSRTDLVDGKSPSERQGDNLRRASCSVVV